MGKKAAGRQYDFFYEKMMLEVELDIEP